MIGGIKRSYDMSPVPAGYTTQEVPISTWIGPRVEATDFALSTMTGAEGGFGLGANCPLGAGNVLEDVASSVECRIPYHGLLAQGLGCGAKGAATPCAKLILSVSTGPIDLVGRRRLRAPKNGL